MVECRQNKEYRRDLRSTSLSKVKYGLRLFLTTFAFGVSAHAQTQESPSFEGRTLQQSLQEMKNEKAQNNCAQTLALASNDEHLAGPGLLGERRQIWAIEWHTLRAACAHREQDFALRDKALEKILILDEDVELDPLHHDHDLLFRFGEMKLDLQARRRAAEGNPGLQSPGLDKVLLRDENTTPARGDGQTSELEHHWVSDLTPFGGNLMLHGRKVRGLIHGSLQSVALGVNIGTYWRLQFLRGRDGYVDSVDDARLYQSVWWTQVASLGVFGLSYLISVADTYNVRRIEKKIDGVEAEAGSVLFGLSGKGALDE